MRQRLMLLMLAVTALATGVVAQTSGDWIYHARFSAAGEQAVVDTRDYIYYLVDNNLFRYDKNTAENEALNHRNVLSDVTVTGLYYNYDKRYMLVTYDNCNIDLLYDDGHVVNMPDLKNANLTAEKTINDVTFATGHVIVATAFGYLDLDDDRGEVRTSRNFGVNVAGAAVVGDRLLLSTATALYYAPVDHYIESLASMSSVKVNPGKLTVVDERRCLLSEGWLLCLTFGDSEVTTSTLLRYAPLAVQPTKSGFIVSVMYAQYYMLLDSETMTTISVNSLQGLYSCAPDGDGTVWGLVDGGLHRADDAEGYIVPDSYGIESTPYYLAYNSSQSKVYLSSTMDNAVLPRAEQGGKTEIYTYDGTRWEDVTPEGVPTGNSGNGNHRLVFCPSDPNTYFFTTRMYGICRARNGELTAVFDASNSPMGRTRELAFDREGNLWAIDPMPGSTNAPDVIVLPKAKVLSDNVTTSDWITPEISGTRGTSIKRASIALGANGNMVFTPGGFQEGIVFWAPDPSTMQPRAHAFYRELIDQDNQSYTWTYIYCLAADRDGIIWIGTDGGVVSCNPAQAYNSDFRINHIKVPRNDGTNIADYLLDGITVHCVAVDAANRKWIGTAGQGLFLVSADGSQIIRQFTTDNSYLPGNTIYDVCCNTDNNSVFVMTDKGLAEYISDSGGGISGEDITELFIYPNPVKPDFMGLVTIQGLGDNSIVKITDSSGLVIKQLKSEGGTVTWDACGNDGERVSTGVYFVIASRSSNGGENASHAIGKLMIIK